ncbi:MAG: TIGR03617 family F420-dependent LLM class oxidoreductase [Gammaproteobacteria bacterium]|nr:TIGR03617 family F420-dependent LLM class oxidoreductase [Gammaproteobacteria bacterium]
MKIGTGVGGWLTGIADGARAAESNGFDFVTCGELAHDSVLTMTVAAGATEHIELDTSVTIAFPRSPMVLAMEAWDLQHYSRGRFNIGLGSQVKGHNERRFGGTWSAPAPRMKEYIQMMKAIWDSWQEGRKPEFLGKHYKYTLMTPNFNPGPIDFPRPKIFLAVVGDAMARVAGEVADGILPHGGIMSDKYMREVLLPNVKIGLERSGRTWADIDIAASGYTVYGENDAEIHKGLDSLRQALSFYGSTRTYHDVLELHGLKYLGDKLHQLSLRGEWQKMREVITDEELLELTQVSTYDNLPKFVAEHREYASRMTYGHRYTTPEERERARAVMTAVQVVQTPGVPRTLEF